MSNILLVDDHAVVRNGVKQILSDNMDQVTIGEASDSVETVFQLRKKSWDLMILDIRLPGHSGIDILKKVKSEHPKLPVLMFSTYPESQYAVRLIKAGAAGYLSKDAEESEILIAVSAILKGGRYINDVVGGLLADYVDRKADVNVEEVPHLALSNREYEIFLHLATGLGPTDIAERLSVSAKTVSTHRSRLLQKMGLSNNAELTLYANNKSLNL